MGVKLIFILIFIKIWNINIDNILMVMRELKLFLVV